MKANVQSIVIEKVGNGFIVTVPDETSTHPMVELQKQISEASNNGGDPLLKSLQGKDEEKEVNVFPSTENVFIFQEFEQVLAFLSKRFL